jgi:hypothetical protein
MQTDTATAQCGPGAAATKQLAAQHCNGNAGGFQRYNDNGRTVKRCQLRQLARRTPKEYDVPACTICPEEQQLGIQPCVMVVMLRRRLRGCPAFCAGDPVDCLGR